MTDPRKRFCELPCLALRTRGAAGCWKGRRPSAERTVAARTRCNASVTSAFYIPDRWEPDRTCTIIAVSRTISPARARRWTARGHVGVAVPSGADGSNYRGRCNASAPSPEDIFLDRPDAPTADPITKPRCCPTATPVCHTVTMPVATSTPTDDRRTETIPRDRFGRCPCHQPAARPHLSAQRSLNPCRHQPRSAQPHHAARC